MQDNKHKDLSEIGWKSMEALLDKEMPVRDNRRRALIFFLLFGMVASTLGYFTLNNLILENDVKTKIEDVALDENLESKVNKEKITTELLVNNTIQETSVLPKTARSESEAVNITPVKNLSGDHSLPSLLQKGDGQNSHESTNFSDDDINKATSIEEIKLKSYSNLEHDTSIKDSGNQTEKVEAIIKKPSINLLDGLSSQDLKMFLIEDRISESPEIVEIMNPNPIFFRFYAGYAFPLASDVKGPEFGFNAGKVLGRRWELQTGIHFLLSNKNYSFLSNYRTEEFDVSFGAPTEVTDEFVGYNTVEELGKNKISEKYYSLVSQKLTKLYFLNIPLQINYKITQKHHVGLGVQYSYLIKGYNDEINLAEIVTSLSNSNSFLGVSTLNDNNLLTKHNFAFRGQYRYEITNKLGVNLTTNYGLNKILKTEAKLDSKNRLSYINVGVAYKL
ncbi:hypothetical protein [Portibacter lacus]|uniref:Outer membrane protein beta-barrel domain-containing protein n=1 Tax=Portibacter lacus TaxID=1099794 RepID=A0AA37ST78_9BACT|nr:hypothetical protein [Portibacter lacus]GLR20093.1 hypothetical protein GCM10007940_47090 [Portibacter lacus]